MSGKRLVVLALAAVLLAARPAHAVDKEAVNEAVEKGVRKLKSLQGDGGQWPHQQIGLTALCGLTLLECGVPVDDRSIQAAAAGVRNAAPDEENTYSLALSILFLDRLGEPVDVALIESLTVRLLGGQTLRGSWTYKCPKVDDTEQRRLKTLVEKRGEGGRVKDPPKEEPGARSVKDLPREIQDQLGKVDQKRADVAQNGGVPIVGDNSNTQFAILALWVARRHGLPVDGALKETEKYFRATQEASGGWVYLPTGGGLGPAMPGAGVSDVRSGQTPAMTCAGLLGIGLAYGAWNEAALHTDKEKKEPGKPRAPEVKPQDPSKDRSVVAAFRLLGVWVDSMARWEGGKPPQLDFRSGRFYYFLWSLERVCVAYGVETVGKTDWYDWGAQILLANQKADGGWDNGDFRNGPDTCFALLVLRRANLAPDLTRALKTQMKDGMQSALRQGGASGSELVKGGGAKPFFGGAAPENPGHKPAAGEDAQAAKLGKQLAAGGDKMEQALKELQKGKGAAYTDALASAIPQLDGEARKKAREALAERLYRMTPATLGVKLDDDDPEVRRAAALAVAMKEDRSFTYKLIEMLDDREATVGHAAHAALKELTKEDFGPAKDATKEQHAKAVLAWKAWWSKQAEKK
jgi:hypothetical protein